MASANKVIDIKQDDISKQFDALRQDVAALATTITELSKEKIEDTALPLKDSTLEQKDSAQDKYKQLVQNAETRIKDNPLTAISAALGVGLVIGLLTRR